MKKYIIKQRMESLLKQFLSFFSHHTTPLAPSLPSQGSWRGLGVGGEAFFEGLV